MESPLKERIREMLRPILTSLELELFEVERTGRVLRVTVDRPGGTVGIEDCTRVSGFLSHALDVEDPIPGRYSLEVSSPGLDRPLRSLDEFRRFTGRLCRLKLVEPGPEGHVLVGRIAGTEGERIRLALPDGGEREVAYGNVAKARLEVEF
jgi:ribosome maturation factor RimP